MSRTYTGIYTTGIALFVVDARVVSTGSSGNTSRSGNDIGFAAARIVAHAPPRI